MNRSRQRWLKLSGWAIPLAYATMALVLGLVFPRVEQRVFPDLVSTTSPSAAMSMCSAIASGMLALTGIVFSLTFLMVQFSATAYSPRLVLWVARDPVVSHALGVFSGTFLYALALMGWVDRSASGEVPLISGWLVVGFLLASMGLFIALIERVGLLQVNRMLIFTGNQGRKAIDDLYPSAASTGPVAKPTDHGGFPLAQTLVHVGRPQVIQAIRTETLVRLAAGSGAVIEVAAAVGDTVVEATPLLQVYTAGHPLDEAELRAVIEMGDERTFEQDPKYAIRLMVDIAIKALSPAINDPTTAVQALDQIEDLLLHLGRRQLDLGTYPDARGTPRVLVPFPTWDDFLRLALDEIRFCGANSVQVMRRMKALIRSLTAVLPPERRPALRHWEERLEGTIARAFADSEEKQEASVADRQGLGIGQGGETRA